MKFDCNRLPQANDVDGDRVQIDEEDQNCSDRSFSLLSLPDDVLISQLTYLGIKEVEQSVKFTCKALFQLSHAQPLWREFCIQTGKLNIGYISNSKECQNRYNLQNDANLNYRDLYQCTPCVPIDFPNITTALQYYRTVKHRLSKLPSPSFTITLMPAVYRERIEIVANSFSTSSSEESNRFQLLLHQPEHDICIRAAFHDKGAAIVHYNQNKMMNQPCVSIINENNYDDRMDENNHERKAVNITLQNLQFLHFTRGSDIWNGNCALQADGQNLKVNILSCSFQSDSGRGVVATRGAHLTMKGTNVHDSAATGIYVGDLFSNLCIEGCNIIRNGGGTRLPSMEGTDEQMLSTAENEIENTRSNVTSENDQIDHDNADVIQIDPLIHHYDQDFDEQRLVPPGHSGMYLESSTSFVKDCAMTNNSLTGLSVVRGGKIKISNCDIFSNGSDSVTIEDAHDVLLGLGEGIRGGVEDLGGNCYSQPDGGGDYRDNDVTVSFARRTVFPHTVHGYMTVEKLRELYSS